MTDTDERVDWADVAAVGDFARRFSSTHPVQDAVETLVRMSPRDRAIVIGARARHIRTIHAARLACARLRVRVLKLEAQEARIMRDTINDKWTRAGVVVAEGRLDRARRVLERLEKQWGK